MTDKKFYWIKLKTDFFNREDIDFLLSQPNGSQYVVLYQMLCLSTANTDGKLETRIGEVIVPFNAEKVVRDCKYFDIDTVNIAMTLYKKMGIVYEQEDGTLRISNYDELVGTETKWAEKKRLYREKQKEIGQSEDNVLIESSECPPESPSNVQQENREKIIDIRDNKKEKKKKKTLALKPKQLECEFDTLWSLYPRKNSKKDALRHYMVARNHGTEYDDVLKGLHAYLEYIRNNRIEPRYIKYGSTWFNQESWNDDYLVINQKRTIKDISMAEIDEALKLERERSGKY